MSIRISFMTVLVPAASVEARYEGGRARLRTELEGVEEEGLVRWVCMSGQDVGEVVEALMAGGLNPPRSPDSDIAIVDMARGGLNLCSWLRLEGDSQTGWKASLAVSSDAPTPKGHSASPAQDAGVRSIADIVQEHLGLYRELEATETGLRRSLNSDERRATPPYCMAGREPIHLEKERIWRALGQGEIEPADALQRHLILMNSYYASRD